MGFSKSPFLKPTARSIARLGERATPAVMSCERLLSFVTSISFRGAYRVIGNSASAPFWTEFGVQARRQGQAGCPNSRILVWERCCRWGGTQADQGRKGSEAE